MASETWALWLRGVSVVDQLKCHLGARGQLVTWGNLQEPSPNFFTTKSRTVCIVRYNQSPCGSSAFCLP